MCQLIDLGNTTNLNGCSDHSMPRGVTLRNVIITTDQPEWTNVLLQITCVTIIIDIEFRQPLALILSVAVEVSRNETNDSALCV